MSRDLYCMGTLDCGYQFDEFVVLVGMVLIAIVVVSAARRWY